MYSAVTEDAGVTYSVFFKNGDEVLFEIPLSLDQSLNDQAALAFMDSWINSNGYPYITVEEFEHYKTVEWRDDRKEQLMTAVGGDVDPDGFVAPTEIHLPE